MKKILPLIVVGILISSGLGAFAITDDTVYNMKTKRESVILSELIIRETGQYATIDLKEATSSLLDVGKPVLPIVTKVFTFPFGSRINSVDVSFSKAKEYMLSKEVQPGAKPVISTDEKQITGEAMKDMGMYDSSGLYPSDYYGYTIKAGLDNGRHVIILAVQCYPVRYSPAQNMIYYSKNFDVTVTYEKPMTPTVFPNKYDLVVIAPEEFSDSLQPLIDHKNSHGVNTTLMTVEDIYSGYEGRDKPEQIKYFIRDSIEQWGVKYVLLVGGMKGQQFGWYVPVRYSRLNDGSEAGFITDLYYADIYKVVDNKTVFDDWDSNGNGIFAEWNEQGEDILDLTPDVYIGRLPCRYDSEVKLMVNKIINYENTASGKNWFKKMVVVGGDSAPGYKFYEGEEENKKALEYMNGFDGTKLWASDGSLTGPSDVINAISDGCGFLFFDGHGNPSKWSTHPSDDKKTWIDGLNNYNMPELKNGEKLPVCVVGACHNGQFNVTTMNIVKGVLHDGFHYFSRKRGDLGEFWYDEWVPECWAWRMVSKINGGAIAIMAYTGLDWFAEGDYDGDGIADSTQYFSGFLNTHFFKNYGVNNITILGQAHTQTLTDYINEFPIDWKNPGNSTLTDCKTIQEFVLMGDPSLRIGGY